MTISIGLLGAAIWLFIQGDWKLGLIVLAIDFILSWVGGYMMMQNDNK